ncbi:MAG: AAA domain-containing protein [Marinilabiliaceae bacterium]
MSAPTRHFFDELLAIHENRELSLIQKIRLQRTSLEQICKFLSREDGITFPNLFGRLEYVSNKFGLHSAQKARLHEFRVFANKVIREETRPDEDEYFSGLKTLAESYGLLLGIEVPADIRRLYGHRKLSDKEPEHYRINPAGFRCMLASIDREKKELTVHPDVPGSPSPVIVRYDVEGVNQELTSSIEMMQPGYQLQLLETRRENSGKVVPGLVVLEPDYLIDVTSVARCFQNIRGRRIQAHELFFTGRAEIRRPTKAIHKGNVANLFFDELLNEQPRDEKDFRAILMDSFRIFPLPYTSLRDINKEYFDELEEQFKNLRRVVDQDFGKGDHRPIDRDRSNLEVFLMSPSLGLQGRMDLFDETPSENGHYQSKIIELKSGKLPFPQDDPNRVAEDHSAQIRMYNMLAQKVLGHHPKKIFNAVLYSSSSRAGEALRYVSHFHAYQREIINLRNQIVAWEYRLASDSEPFQQSESFVRGIDVRKFGVDPADQRFSWFFNKFLDYKKLLLERISPLERRYFFAFSSFISREKILSKVGDGEYTKGLSALWNKTDLPDEDVFNELRDLRIKENKADVSDAYIVLSRPAGSHRFINFRRGDICVFYPFVKDKPLATQHRVLKCSIENISNDEVAIRLRQKQSSLEYFNNFDTWVLEHDSLDNNFEQMHSGLFEFLKLPAAKRELLLGIRPPACDQFEVYPFVDDAGPTCLSESSHEQNEVLSGAWYAKDYFLLVGPPGTGKTNLFLKRLVREMIGKTDHNVLLVSYTNRAVDEMCSSVRAIVDDEMIRIGSSLGCDHAHKDLLLDHKISGLQSRKEIRTMIEDTRLFAGTLSSLLGKPELFELKKFDMAIVDEASQILEPNIINLLGRVDRFVLIGDERQLPAVVTQSPKESKVSDETLQGIGLYDRRNSYFERLLYLCKKNGWNYAWGELTFQGRMHPDLADVPNRLFYENKLRMAALSHQTEELFAGHLPLDGEVPSMLARQRLVFIPSAFSVNEISTKSNSVEARLISKILGLLGRLHHFPESEMVEKTGIITPYRNQIACIREQLENDGFHSFDKFQIDTVERFQGSQKDFILVSFCIDKPSQLDFLAQSRVFLENGDHRELIDRKLNVTLTRARKQLIMTGNEAVLAGDEIYGRLIEDIRDKGGYFRKGARSIVNS